MMRLLLAWFLIPVASIVHAQTLNFQDYLGTVLSYHPMAQRANLMPNLGEAELLKARGSFDPKLQSEYNRKDFSESLYYSEWTNEVVIPTLAGFDITAGYMQNDGEFLDASLNTPDRGLWNIGVEIPLLQGLMTDGRRTALKQAKLGVNINEQDRIAMLNQLVRDAGIAYVEWASSQLRYNIAENSYQLASVQFENILTSFKAGDKPAVDTLEAFVRQQNRLQLLLKYQADLETQRIATSLFLWGEGNTPMQIDPEAIPDSLSGEELASLASSLQMRTGEITNQHPMVQTAGFELEQSLQNQKLQRELLKPELRVKVNPLIGTTDSELFTGFSTNNYTVGAKLSIPLLFRKGRGASQAAAIKVTQHQLKQTEAVRKVENRLQQVEVQLGLLRDQLDLAILNVELNTRLFEAENKKFLAGESSLFILNNRESKLLESRMKYTDLLEKLIASRLTYVEAAAGFEIL